MRETVPVLVIAPEVPVTVMTYVPGVVPEFPPPPPAPPLPLPPQPSAPPTMKKSNTSIPRMLQVLRRRAGMPTSRMHARAVPPTNGPKNLLVRLRAEVADIVYTVRVTVCGAELLMVAEAGMMHVAGSLGAVGVIVQLRLITPVNPFEGVKVIVDVFPVVAPGATLTAVPVMEKLPVTMV